MRIEPRPLPEQLPDLGDLPPPLTRLYAARGVQSISELDKGLARLVPYGQLKGIDAAVALLVEAIETRQRILFVGDFDAVLRFDFKCKLQKAHGLFRAPTIESTVRIDPA